MIAILLKALSGAALSIIAKLIGQPALEELLGLLLVRGAEAIAKNTGNTVDDELAQFLRRQLSEKSGAPPSHHIG